MTRTIPGSGAQVTATLDSSYGVASFNIISGGTGYATTDPPKIEVQGTSTPTVAGSFYPIIQNGSIVSIKVLSPGSGYIPSVSIAQTAVGIASIGRSGSDDVVKSIYVANPGFGYTETATVTISNPDVLTGVGTYFFNEIVYGERSLTEARVKDWDQDTKILQITNVGIGSTRNAFYPGEVIIGKESEARYSLQNFEQYDTNDKYSENDLFESEADAILDFSESNPFGTF